MHRGKFQQALDTDAGVQEAVRTQDIHWESSLQTRELGLSKGRHGGEIKAIRL